jgi:hypothetical protein
VGCGFGHCPSRVACSPAIDPCPSGAICTLRFTSQFADADPAITFSLVPYCQSHSDCLSDELDDNWRVTQQFDAGPDSQCEAAVLDDPRACDVTSSQTILGRDRTISQTCKAQILDSIGRLLKPGDVLARDFGADASRHLDCDATESIAPASALDIASLAPGSNTTSVYAPAAGGLVLTPIGRIHASVARQRPPQPAISTLKITVTHPGPVTVRLRPNQAAKRILARRHKLTLREKITLTLAHQTAITRIQTLTLTQPAKPPSARQRRRAAHRLCLRTHPHQTRFCNRL